MSNTSPAPAAAIARPSMSDKREPAVCHRASFIVLAPRSDWAQTKYDTAAGSDSKRKLQYDDHRLRGHRAPRPVAPLADHVARPGQRHDHDRALAARSPGL